MLVCYSRYENGVCCVLNFIYVVSYFLEHIEPYTRFSSQESVHRSHLESCSNGSWSDDLCLLSCAFVYKKVTTDDT